MNLVVNGLLAQYHETGKNTGPVTILLHGWGVNSQNLAALAQAVGQSRRVISLDLPGFGGSEAPKEPWHIQDYAQFVHDFLEKLGAELYAVVGHSFGGRVAIRGISSGLIPAGRLVLLDSAGIKPAGSAKRSAYRAAAKAGKTVLKLPGLSQLAPGLRKRLYQSAGSTDYLNAGPLRETFVNVINEDLSADAAKIKVPALLIWGADDTDTPPADGRTLANLIPGSRLSILAGAGHFVHTDAPDRVEALITEFLGQ